MMKGAVVMLTIVANKDNDVSLIVEQIRDAIKHSSNCEESFDLIEVECTNEWDVEE